MELQQKIIALLQHAQKPLAPSQISLLVGFPRPTNTAKTVNPTLYMLEKEGRVQKIANENGSNPKWKIV